MQITIDISAEMQREAAERGLPIAQFVEMVVERGLESVRDRSSVSSAVDRIRALRRSESEPISRAG